ncbi:diguanylate cyclase (GGDEF)-like protein [Paraburkholderia sp. BL18I3N2]|uniref:sensor domain-containing diguanylate cyclase n=1 Tax=Paraburkholderia sp. BL18I3N2 TaxID=1938799 RepID=UPI000D067DF9|nr:sensor domain-containing diguanylate cyclase [Paraburkholderia sp. BL18I3N2]PRX30635.1 diguanylate cyclase (GGDEF)-like protein [Paraburkholderia sp. BL18I3N2]
MHSSLPLSVRQSVSSSASRVLSPSGVIVCGVLLILFTCSLCAWVLFESRKDAYNRAEENARNLMLVIERDIARNIELYDLSLQAVVEGVADPQVMALPEKIRSGVLFDRAASGKYLGSIFVMNERGDIVLDSGFVPARAGNFGDRDYFSFHRDNGNTGLYISKPYASRLRDGALTIALSRRIAHPDGSFGGVVVGTLSIDYFRALLDGLSVGERGTAAVIETNGAMITRLPYDPKVVGRDIRNAPVFIQAMSTNEGAFAGTASIDGVRRLYVYKRLTGLPIIVDVAPAESDVYAEWRRRALRLEIVMAVFSIILGAGSLLLSRELRRRQRAESKLQHLARTDALTGLSNRGAFDDTLQKEWQRANRSGRPLSLLFIDIDQFKAYNDYYGHQAGDEVLRAVAQCVGLCVLRSADQAARYGGEEFVVTLPDTDATGATNVAETIRRAVFDLNLEHVQSRYGRVTVSIGLVTSDGRVAHDGATLVNMADSALYEAKSTGRNRVCEA